MLGDQRSREVAQEALSHYIEGNNYQTYERKKTKQFFEFILTTRVPGLFFLVNISIWVL